MAVVSFHFHGYQPGDLVRWMEPDPLKPPRFEERHSPVSLAIGGESVRGGNWTDAVLRAYGRMEHALEAASGAASVDIEPQTLAWLLAKDGDAYRRVVAAWERGAAGLAMTPPFHPILPHHHTLERQALFDLMIDFHAPLLRRVHGRPIGLWLPEAAYSADAMRDYLVAARRAAGTYEDLPDLAHGVHLILDSRQIAKPSPGSAWCRLPLDGGVPCVARDVGLSGSFSFGASKAADFAATAKARGADSLLVASDLESLLANPLQVQRFGAIAHALDAEGFEVSAPAPAETARLADVLENSSWSDYDEHLHEGHTSDTRWTGLRRWDGHVVCREHRGKKLSELWKHAFTLATEQVETAVRRAARDLLPGDDVERRRDVLRRLAVAYGRHLWREHYLASGLGLADVDFPHIAERIVGGAVDVDLLGYLARGYVTMLMGLRSDPRFWDNLDTRVTFQNVACLAQSLLDVSEAWRRAGEPSQAERALRLLRATLLEFPEAYARQGLGALRGAEGWETTEEAWLRSVQSEVPARSGHDVVRRAALYALGERAREHEVPVPAKEVVADTGQIVGEDHGAWENPEWCEHRQE